MKNIFVIGAGLVAQPLIDYLVKHSTTYNWKVTVGDLNLKLASEKVKNHPNARAIEFNVLDDEQRETQIQQHDVVVSLLPAKLHHIPAETCLKYNSHLITASYVSKKLKQMEEAVKSKNLLFLGECGLDPGIDHMTIMSLLNQIEQKNGTLISVRSFTGGLIAPESDTNPWNYKFTWAPRNVVLAGQGTAQYKKDNRLKFIPYHRLFKLYDEISVEGYGTFDAYANRDSLKYTTKYQLEKVPTFIRGTLRKQGFCDAWATLVQLGLTDDSFPIIGSQNLTYNQMISAFLPNVGATDKNTLKQRLQQFLNLPNDNIILDKLDWLELFDNRKIKLKNATPAQILQDLLEEKWALQPNDKDLIVMTHILEYELENRIEKLSSTLTYEGKDATDTAMSRLVGVPLAIATKLLLTDEINCRGLKIPIEPQIYEPILKELAIYGVHFTEAVKVINKITA